MVCVLRCCQSDVSVWINMSFVCKRASLHLINPQQCLVCRNTVTFPNQPHTAKTLAGDLLLSFEQVPCGHVSTFFFWHLSDEFSCFYAFYVTLQRGCVLLVSSIKGPFILCVVGEAIRYSWEMINTALSFLKIDTSSYRSDTRMLLFPNLKTVYLTVWSWFEYIFLCWVSWGQSCCGKHWIGAGSNSVRLGWRWTSDNILIQCSIHTSLCHILMTMMLK